MSVPSRLFASKSNRQSLTITGVYDEVGQAYLNAATVTATLYDSTGAAVSGFSAVTLSYIAGSNGNYRGIVTSAFNPAVGVDYTLKIDGVQASSTFHLEIPVTVQVRAK